eukprot:gene24908-biopygen19330
MIIASDAGIIRGENDIIDFVASAKDAVVESVDSDLMTASDLSREYESMSFLDDGAHNSQMSTSSCRFLSLDAIDPVSGGFPAFSSSQQHLSAAASAVTADFLSDLDGILSDMYDYTLFKQGVTLMSSFDARAPYRYFNEYVMIPYGKYIKSRDDKFFLETNIEEENLDNVDFKDMKFDFKIVDIIRSRVLYGSALKNHSTSKTPIVVDVVTISNKNVYIAKALENLRVDVQKHALVLKEPKVTTNVSEVTAKGTNIEVRYPLSADDYYTLVDANADLERTLLSVEETRHKVVHARADGSSLEDELAKLVDTSLYKELSDTESDIASTRIQIKAKRTLVLNSVISSHVRRDPPPLVPKMARSPSVMSLDDCGIGGHAVALKGLARPCCFCEIDSFACGVLSSQFPGIPIISDVTTLDPLDVIASSSRVGAALGPDLITASFPCQDVSMAGKGGGLSGTRSSLVWEVFHVLDGLPSVRAVFLENSPALRYRGLDAICEAFETRGFSVRYGILSAADMGARHVRSRIWVLAARDKDAGMLFPYLSRTRLSSSISQSLSYPFAKLDAEMPRLVTRSPGTESRADVRSLTLQWQALGNAIVPQAARFAFAVLLTEMRSVFGSSTSNITNMGRLLDVGLSQYPLVVRPCLESLDRAKAEFYTRLYYPGEDRLWRVSIWPTPMRSSSHFTPHMNAAAESSSYITPGHYASRNPLILEALAELDGKTINDVEKEVCCFVVGEQRCGDSMMLIVWPYVKDDFCTCKAACNTATAHDVPPPTLVYLPRPCDLTDDMLVLEVVRESFVLKRFKNVGPNCGQVSRESMVRSTILALIQVTTNQIDEMDDVVPVKYKHDTLTYNKAVLYRELESYGGTPHGQQQHVSREMRKMGLIENSPKNAVTVFMVNLRKIRSAIYADEATKFVGTIRSDAAVTATGAAPAPAATHATAAAPAPAATHAPAAAPATATATATATAAAPEATDNVLDLGVFPSVDCCTALRRTFQKVAIKTVDVCSGSVDLVSINGVRKGGGIYFRNYTGFAEIVVTSIKSNYDSILVFVSLLLCPRLSSVFRSAPCSVVFESSTGVYYGLSAPAPFFTMEDVLMLVQSGGIDAFTLDARLICGSTILVRSSDRTVRYLSSRNTCIEFS